MTLSQIYSYYWSSVGDFLVIKSKILDRNNFFSPCCNSPLEFDEVATFSEPEWLVLLISSPVASSMTKGVVLLSLKVGFFVIYFSGVFLNFIW